MAHFSEYQVRRFRFIFNQYSEDAVGEANLRMDSSATKSSDKGKEKLDGTMATL
ncbi:hypothetical protein HDU96_003156, partial [Phlyctochytrium bullatum]